MRTRLTIPTRVTRRDLSYAFALVVAIAVLLGPLLSGCDSLDDLGAEGGAITHVAEASAPSGPAPQPTGPGCETGTQSSGALYEICLPDGGPNDPDGDSNDGTLVVYAHGFVFPQRPLELPTTEGGVNVREFVTSQGFAYAATSYYANGLVDPPKGVKDLRELITIYTRLYERPERVLLLGFSNGTLLASHALEQHPGLFDGALASCGVHGSYTREVDYLGDLFVVFEHVFPEALGLFGVDVGGPEGINPAFLAALAREADRAGVPADLYLAGYLQGVLSDPDNAARTGQLLGVIAATPEIQAAFVTPAEGVETVIRGVTYNVFATNNVLDVLGGHPYENADRVYASPFGAAYDQVLNASIARYEADAGARAQLRARFETSGKLRDPFVALHTPRDPLAPLWQEALYLEKVGEPSLYDLRVVDGARGGYGHCTFTPEEVESGFDALLSTTNAVLVPTL